MDTILKMPEEVQTLTGLEHQEFMGIMGSYLYESVGVQEFARRHMLTQSPCVIAPSTAHISFTKAVTVLGLGRESLVTVPVDEDARMEPKGNLIMEKHSNAPASLKRKYKVFDEDRDHLVIISSSTSSSHMHVTWW